MKNKKQDSKMTRPELEKAIRQLEKIRNNQFNEPTCGYAKGLEFI